MAKQLPLRTPFTPAAAVVPATHFPAIQDFFNFSKKLLKPFIAAVSLRTVTTGCIRVLVGGFIF